MIVRATRSPAVKSIVLVLVLAIAIAVGAVSCAAAAVDPQQLGSDLARDIGKAGDGTSFSCPSGQPATAGTTFTCTAATAKGALVYDITITSDTGEYRYALAPGQAVDSGALAAELTAQLRGGDPALAAATVTCPASILAPGGAVDVTCTAVAGTAQVPMKVVGPPGRALTWTFNAA